MCTLHVLPSEINITHQTGKQLELNAHQPPRNGTEKTHFHCLTPNSLPAYNCCIRRKQLGNLLWSGGNPSSQACKVSHDHVRW